MFFVNFNMEIKDNIDLMFLDCDMFYMELCIKFIIDFY